MTNRLAQFFAASVALAALSVATPALAQEKGSNVSFSQRHTKKVWKPNLQKKTIIVDGKKVTMKISTQAIRTLKKKGLLTPVGSEAK